MMGHCKSNVKLPHLIFVEVLADEFSNLFVRNITIMRDKIISESLNYSRDVVINPEIMFTGKMLEMVRPASSVGVKEIATRSLNKSMRLGSTAHLDFEEISGSTSSTTISYHQMSQ